MQTSKKLLIALCAIFCASCATPKLTERAAKVHVHKQSSTLLADCKKLGPVSAIGEAVPGEDAYDGAKRLAREKAAEMGADTLAITDATGTPFKATVQAVALRCY